VGARANHDLIVSKIISTARGDCGLITSAGRLIRISALDLPTVPSTAHSPNLQGGTHVSELVTLAADEKVLCLTTLSEDSLGLALGTAQGVVKRVNPDVLGRDSWDVIRLEPGDRLVGAVELATTEAELVFITNDAQLLHFPAANERAARGAAFPASNRHRRAHLLWRALCPSGGCHSLGHVPCFAWNRCRVR
jgi:DNA gyrase subunit A